MSYLKTSNLYPRHFTLLYLSFLLWKKNSKKFYWKPEFSSSSKLFCLFLNVKINHLKWNWLQTCKCHHFLLEGWHRLLANLHNRQVPDLVAASKPHSKHESSRWNRCSSPPILYHRRRQTCQLSDCLEYREPMKSWSLNELVCPERGKLLKPTDGFKKTLISYANQASFVIGYPFLLNLYNYMIKNEFGKR